MTPSSSQSRLTVLSGPSGVGKGTLVALLRERHPELWLSVSATTRPPRPGEEEGVHYFFHSQESFQELVASGGKVPDLIVPFSLDRFDAFRQVNEMGATAASH